MKGIKWESTDNPISKAAISVAYLYFDLTKQNIDKFAKAIEYVKEYCPASDEAKFPPKIVKDSVSK